jgi:hypothetical protein
MSSEDFVNTNFPLFDLLTEQTQDVPLSQPDLIDFVQNVKKLDKKGFDLLFVIIRIYSIKTSTNNNSVNLNDIPYSGQKMETGEFNNKMDVKFDIRNFPNKLNQMLYHFTKLHLNKDTIQRINESD